MTTAPSNISILQSLERLPELLVQFRQKAPLRFSKRGLSALVVEDQLFSRKMLHDALRDFCAVESAKDAREALATYLTNPPHIAFLDIELQSESGHDLAKIIRQIDPEAFIVMVTGNKTAEDIATARDNAVDGYIVKPFNKQKIIDCIDKYAALHPVVTAGSKAGT